VLIEATLTSVDRSYTYQCWQKLHLPVLIEATLTSVDRSYTYQCW